MPLLTLKTNHTIPNRQGFAELASSTVANLLGKPESYVMVSIEDQQTLMFAGSHLPCAFIEVKSLGMDEQKTDDVSQQLCELVKQQLNIESSRVYIEFSNPPRHMWGWDSRTF